MSDNMKSSALLIIDIQKGLFNRPPGLVYEEIRLLENINMLIDRAHSAAIPVIYIRHSNETWCAKGSDNWEFHPSLKIPYRDDPVISKTNPNAFQGDLQRILLSLNVKKLVVVGVLTHGCVKATCIQAQELGYQVVLVEDGHSNFEDNAPDIIHEWNGKLSQKGIIIKATAMIDFF